MLQRALCRRGITIAATPSARGYDSRGVMIEADALQYQHLAAIAGVVSIARPVRERRNRWRASCGRRGLAAIRL